MNHLTNYKDFIAHQNEAVLEVFRNFYIFIKFSKYGLYSAYTTLYS